MKKMQKKILHWYTQFGRDLPWRFSRNPYEILVSEVMLQQTQVSRVLVKYPLFLKKYPNFASLAHAPKGDVIRQWEGMGYNNRILRLQKLAQTVCDKPFPNTPDELKKLDGVGPYTAHAVCCFAFEQDVPVVDVNIRRVFSRIFNKLHYTGEMLSEKEIWPLAKKLVPKGFGFDWNQSLMDLGATICTAHNPKCDSCPVEKECKSANTLVKRKRVKKSSLVKGEKKILPNRIYRGRVVQFLRNNHGWQDISKVGQEIREDIDNNKEWFEKILSGLEKDGMIEVKRKGKKLLKITLP